MNYKQIEIDNISRRVKGQMNESMTFKESHFDQISSILISERKNLFPV